MFVTTAGRTNEQMIEKAKEIAGDLNIPYVHRLKRSIMQTQNEMNGDCLVVGKERLEFVTRYINWQWVKRIIEGWFESENHERSSPCSEAACHFKGLL